MISHIKLFFNKIKGGLNLSKSFVALLVLASLITGSAMGAAGMYYAQVMAPEKKAKMIAKKQQEELNKMIRRGLAVEIAPKEISIKVEKGGGDIGDTIKVGTNENTTIQVGKEIKSSPGKEIDLTQFFRLGDKVDMLVKDGFALALHKNSSLE